MQVRVRTNMSDPFPKKIVRERLPMGSAFYGERLRDIVYWVMVEYCVGDGIAYNFHWRLDRTPIHPRRVSPHPRISTLMDAPTSNRRRIRPRSRPRTISCGLGRSKIGAHTDLHKLYPSPIFIKVLPGFFKSRVPLVPYKVTPLTQLPSEQWCLPAFPDRRRALRDRVSCRNPSAALSVRGRPSAVPLRPRVHRRSGS